MSLEIGIIGLPNVGKSTLFNALTQAGAEASDYPFCTVDPNVGVVLVPDRRLAQLERVLEPESSTPTHIRFLDIAGLVRGASKGEGLGNRFLAHVREADALVHVVRCFGGDRVSHVDGSVDPLRDIGTVETELMLADLETAAEAAKKLEKVVRADPRAPEKRLLDAVLKAGEGLERGVPVKDQSLSAEERSATADYRFLTAKHTIYLANVDESALPDGGSAVEPLRGQVGEDRVLVIAAQIESEIAELTPEDRVSFLSDLGLGDTGVNRLVLAGYRMLNLITFYTTANRKLQAWQLPEGLSAPQAAGRIHTDMERGFIRAEVADADQLIREGSVERLRNSGRLRTEGKDYVVRDGDVVNFLFRA